MKRLCLAALALPAVCLPQSGRAELFGMFHDPSALSVPNAKVEAEDQATMVRYSAASGEHGEYDVLGLPASNYGVTVSRPRFQTCRQPGVTIRRGDRIEHDSKREVGQTSQT